MITNCIHCGARKHPGVCPLVKAIEYYEDGTVKRVEYKCAADYAFTPAQFPVLTPVPGCVTYAGAGDMNTAHSFTIGPDGVARFS